MSRRSRRSSRGSRARRARAPRPSDAAPIDAAPILIDAAPHVDPVDEVRAKLVTAYDRTQWDLAVELGHELSGRGQLDADSGRFYTSAAHHIIADARPEIDA